ncbi:MAG: PP2C family protein-serine/threonine phosphatase [Bacteroidota bacterium]
MNAATPWGITAKQAMATVAVVLVLSIAGSLVELYFDWHATRDQLRGQVTQILDTVNGSAVEAAYQLSPDLAVRVVDGLLGYDIVAAARLHDNFGDTLAQRQRYAAPDEESRIARLLFGDMAEFQRALVRPRPGGGVAVGGLGVTLSVQGMASGFYDRVLINLALGLARSLGIVALVVGIFYAMITRPLVRLSQVVARIDPNQPGALLMPALRGHAADELGQLVNSLNAMLVAAQQGLDQRDQAQAENLRLGTELEVSRRIQQMVLPTLGELEQIRGLDVAAYMEPATEVGGDYYDILQGENGQVRIGIGDVTGHGLESGVVMLMTQSAVRTLVTSAEPDAVRVLDILNRTIYHNTQRMGCDKNLTLALLDYRPTGAEDGSAGHLRISGQHESVIVVRRDGTVELVDTVDLGMPLGLIDDIGSFVAEADIALRPGDTVVLYTDGITEAADDRHNLYGLDRLCDVVRHHAGDGAALIKDAVIADVKRHVGAQALYDDLTLIVLKQL